MIGDERAGCGDRSAIAAPWSRRTSFRARQQRAESRGDHAGRLWVHGQEAVRPSCPQRRLNGVVRVQRRRHSQRPRAALPRPCDQPRRRLDRQGVLKPEEHALGLVVASSR